MILLFMLAIIVTSPHPDGQPSPAEMQRNLDRMMYRTPAQIRLSEEIFAHGPKIRRRYP